MNIKVRVWQRVYADNRVLVGYVSPLLRDTYSGGMIVRKP